MPSGRSILIAATVIVAAFLCTQILFTLQRTYLLETENDVSNVLRIQVLGWNSTSDFKSEISRAIVTQGRGTIANQDVDLQLQLWVHSKSLQIQLQSSLLIESPNNELVEIKEVILLSCCEDNSKIIYHPTLTKSINSESQFLNLVELMVGTQSLGVYVGVLKIKRGSNPTECKCNLYNCTEELQQKMLDLSQLNVTKRSGFKGKYLRLTFSNNQLVLFKPYGGKPIHQTSKYGTTDQGWAEIATFHYLMAAGLAHKAPTVISRKLPYPPSSLSTPYLKEIADSNGEVKGAWIEWIDGVYGVKGIVRALGGYKPVSTPEETKAFFGALWKRNPTAAEEFALLRIFDMLLMDVDRQPKNIFLKCPKKFVYKSNSTSDDLRTTMIDLIDAMFQEDCEFIWLDSGLAFYFSLTGTKTDPFKPEVLKFFKSKMPPVRLEFLRKDLVTNTMESLKCENEQVITYWTEEFVSNWLQTRLDLVRSYLL